jgi:hypothetical protein
LTKQHFYGIFCFMPRRFHELDLLNQEVLGILASNEVVIDRGVSHAHLDRAALEEALFLIDSGGRDFLAERVDLGRPIGVARCIETDTSDRIVYAYRLDRVGPTRFVLDREPEPTTQVTVILRRDDKREGLMVLITAWAGGKSEPEPWDQSHDESSLAASQAFWSTHALNWEPNEVDFSRPFGLAEDMQDHLPRARFL